MRFSTAVHLRTQCVEMCYNVFSYWNGYLWYLSFTCVHIYIHIQMYIHTYTYMHIKILTYIYICVCIYMHIYMYIYIYVLLSACATCLTILMQYIHIRTYVTQYSLGCTRQICTLCIHVSMYVHTNQKCSFELRTCFLATYTYDTCHTYQHHTLG